MNIPELLSGIALLVLAAVFAVKYFSCKRQLRSFAKTVARSRDNGYRQPVKVESFAPEIVTLANELNLYIDVQRKRSESYMHEKEDLTRIISGISHDFRTPLTAALGYLQLIEKSGELSPKNQEYLAVAYEKNRYLKQLSDDFFALSRLENSQEAPKKERLDFSTLLSEQVLEQYGWISEKKLQTHFQIPEGIVLESDPHLLKRILNNLFSNAEKYAEDFFSVTLEETEDTVILRIGNGCPEGIETEISRIFEPFCRAASENKNGSGLGLYIVKCISEQLGCTVSAEADGTQFTMELLFPRYENQPVFPK